MKRIGLLVPFTFALLPATAIAQVQTGTPPFGAFGGGPDVINLANLKCAHHDSSAPQTGRGLDFAYDITNGTSLWDAREQQSLATCGEVGMARDRRPARANTVQLKTSV